MSYCQLCGRKAVCDRSRVSTRHLRGLKDASADQKEVAPERRGGHANSSRLSVCGICKSKYGLNANDILLRHGLTH